MSDFPHHFQKLDASIQHARDEVKAHPESADDAETLADLVSMRAVFVQEVERNFPPGTSN